MNELIVFLDAIRAHLVRHNLPGAIGVRVTTWREPVKVQLDGWDLTEVAGQLCSWAASLDGSTAELHRLADGSRVLVTVVGRLPCGAPVHVYGAVRYTRTALPDLPVAVTQEVPVWVLRGWARGRQGVAA
ncbi:hypothetical protein [Prauserella cavernicola]|uniref:Uncharacterized protein n=1 Tax=Prauserella cavernicola TaxID=2800127 RepID=A0A934V5K2_9PSEU|nr:hypothetical protein [Prauserella cavernicola]MBK1785230.1 hypothetical protein [Prauserella cavernicola]